MKITIFYKVLFSWHPNN